MWTSGFTSVLQLSRDLINVVLAKFIQVLKAQNQHLYTASLGIFGKFEAELLELALKDLQDPPPAGGQVSTSAYGIGSFQLRLFGFIRLRSQVRLDLEDVNVELVYDTARQPESVILSVDRTTRTKVSFPGAGWLIRWLLNGAIAPVVSFGLWLAFRIVQKVKIPVWQLVNAVGALGLRLADGSPVVGAVQGPVEPTLLLASDFVQAGLRPGNPNGLSYFLPAGANAGAAVHERIAKIAVDLAIAKGWLPRSIKVRGIQMKLKKLSLSFHPGQIRVNGKMEGKGKKCWCRVKVRVYFNAAINPLVDAPPGQAPALKFSFAADAKAEVSTSGMLSLLSMIIAGPLFLAFAVSVSFIFNLLLGLLLPFNLKVKQQGLQLNITITGAQAGGLPPLNLYVDLDLKGQGVMDLSPFTQFQLPNNVPLQLAFTNESLSLEDKELRLAARIF